MNLELDPRWTWIDVSTLDEGRGTSFVRGECNHLDVEEVHSVDGVLVAALCRTCDTQWTFPYDPEGQYRPMVTKVDWVGTSATRTVPIRTRFDNGA